MLYFSMEMADNSQILKEIVAFFLQTQWKRQPPSCSIAWRKYEKNGLTLAKFCCSKGTLRSSGGKHVDTGSSTKPARGHAGFKTVPFKLEVILHKIQTRRFTGEKTATELRLADDGLTPNLPRRSRTCYIAEKYGDRTRTGQILMSAS